MAAVAFELSGPFTADMLSPVDAIWDVWHWKALRWQRSRCHCKGSVGGRLVDR